MVEQWVLDEEEEWEAQVELAEKVTMEKVEAQKQAQKDKRRQQAEARRKAKRAETANAFATQGAGSASATPQRGSSVVSQREESVCGSSVVVEERYDPASLAIPSHMQRGNVYSPGVHGFEHVDSPAPTVTSSINMHGIQSGYTSENADTPFSNTPDASSIVVGYQQEYSPQLRQLQPWTEFDLRAL